ncbi:RagB/SusD family nutrient uptake outer membrane protein [Geofilum rhodophaeum]|uniref:RagB/SusD family nutrient uptake outer membrane protein n=1 Tax=Geofilum rhodophaeum TaxID=1965019 RepID=UPI000B5246C2|nr:RagB/SusD family nutrient uptake outer membrane protein [Geofilum rhodophaeum]
MKKIKIFSVVLAALATFSACTNDLEQYPNIEETSKTVYDQPENYLSALAKCYASFVTAGQGKGGEDEDLSSNNGYDYMRCYFNMQEAGTDELGSTWIEGDNIGNLTYLSWDAQDSWVADMYYRSYYSISLCNEFLKNSTDERIAGFGESDQENIRRYRAEARFLRALAYFHAMDLFHHIPFADESLIGSSQLPERWEAKDIFNFLETELKAVGEILPSAANTEYGRTPRGAAWMLLARMYLNAETYGAGEHYEACMTYAQKVLDEGYALEPDYNKLFNADNHKRVGAGQEIIFPLVVDSRNVVSWGATTYLACGQVDTDFGPAAETLGVASAWSMFRVRGEIPALFEGSTDDRALFYSEGQNQYMDGGVSDRSGGFFVVKWDNRADDGTVASDTDTDGVDIDFPLFRLADAYLMYAEAALRSNTGLDQALDLVNELRINRNAPEVSLNDLSATVDGIPFKFFLDERGRELYWEAVRRTDLIRFDAFTSDKYLWQWKGGVKDGKAVDQRYRIYPIPATELSANPNLFNEDY